MRFSILLPLLTFLLAASCTKPTDTGPQFDRLALQSHIYIQQILPATDSAERAATQLSQTITALTANPDTTRLRLAKASWLSAATAFNRLSPFCFGPGNLPVSGSLRATLNTFPTGAAALEQEAVSAATPTMQGPRSQRGLPALEYLLFGLETQDALLKLQTQPSRGPLMQRCAEGILQGIAQARTQWKTAGIAFTTDNSTSAGSAISELYNGLVEDFEIAKNYKLALPLGVMAGQDAAQPERTEGYYSGASAQLLEAQLEALHAIYTGESLNGQTGPGFDDYLKTVDGGEALVVQTNTQFQAIEAAFAGLPSQPLAQTIRNQPAAALVLQQQVQKLTRYYKSDMSSLLGLSITFSSSDGD